MGGRASWEGSSRGDSMGQAARGRDGAGLGWGQDGRGWDGEGMGGAGMELAMATAVEWPLRLNSFTFVREANENLGSNLISG